MILFFASESKRYFSRSVFTWWLYVKTPSMMVISDHDIVKSAGNSDSGISLKVIFIGVNVLISVFIADLLRKK
ncbi:hypothetical protein UA45_16035 [Morganella morganii]|uniref:Uncharacterized protein n=1 Tax=Morganella morganii TaxID=582 RepID=A0A0D8L526_MORMO|nr:hypothetical protein UA45_16035 [Morganella morganii]